MVKTVKLTYRIEETQGQLSKQNFLFCFVSSIILMDEVFKQDFNSLSLYFGYVYGLCITRDIIIIRHRLQSSYKNPIRSLYNDRT